MCHFLSKFSFSHDLTPCQSGGAPPTTTTHHWQLTPTFTEVGKEEEEEEVEELLIPTAVRAERRRSRSGRVWLRPLHWLPCLTDQPFQE